MQNILGYEQTIHTSNDQISIAQCEWRTTNWQCQGSCYESLSAITDLFKEFPEKQFNVTSQRCMSWNVCLVHTLDGL